MTEKARCRLVSVSCAQPDAALQDAARQIAETSFFIFSPSAPAAPAAE